MRGNPDVFQGVHREGFERKKKNAATADPPLGGRDFCHDAVLLAAFRHYQDDFVRALPHHLRKNSRQLGRVPVDAVEEDDGQDRAPIHGVGRPAIDPMEPEPSEVSTNIVVRRVGLEAHEPAGANELPPQQLNDPDGRRVDAALFNAGGRHVFLRALPVGAGGSGSIRDNPSRPGCRDFRLAVQNPARCGGANSSMAWGLDLPDGAPHAGGPRILKVFSIGYTHCCEAEVTDQRPIAKMPGIESFITGGAEGDCAPPIVVYAILIVVVLLALNAMGTIALKQGFNKSPNASSSMRYQIQGQPTLEQDLKRKFAEGHFHQPSGSDGREGFDFSDPMGPGQGGPVDDFDAMLNAAANNLPGSEIDAAGANEFADVIVAGGYGDYAGIYDSVDRVVVDAATAKAAWEANKAAAQAQFWSLVGGENSCELPVASSAFAEALSLSAANGDLPCGTATAGAKSVFAQDLGDA